MPNSQTFYTGLGIGKESTPGTAVARTAWLPIEQPRFQPQDLRHIIDSGFRAVQATEFDLIPGPGEGKFSFNGDVYVDSVPHLFMNLFGLDTVSGTSPYTHTLKLPAAAATLPPTHSIEWQQNVQAYLFAYARVSELTVNFSARDGALTYSCQGMSKLGVTTAATSASFSSSQSLAGWQGAVTVAGGAPASLLEGSLTFRRALKPLHALAGTQDITALYPQGMQVTGRLTFDYTQTTEWGYYASATPTKNIVVLTFTQGASAIFKVTMSSAGWRMVTPDPNDNIYNAVAEINGLYNATDTGPAQVAFTNAQMAGY